MSGTTGYAWAVVFAALPAVPVPWIAAGAVTVFAAGLIVGVVLQRRSPDRHPAGAAELPPASPDVADGDPVSTDAATTEPGSDAAPAPEPRPAAVPTVGTDAPPSPEEVDTMTSPRSEFAEADEPAPPNISSGRVPAHTPDDRVSHEDASLLWPDARLLAEPPADYTPLEIPAIWEPDPAAPIWAQRPQEVDPAPHPGHPSAYPDGRPAAPHHPVAPPQQHPATPPQHPSAPPQQQWPPQQAPATPYGVPAPQQPHLPPQHPAAGPPAGYVISVPEIGSTTGNSPTGNIPTGRRPQGPAAPRSFRDLRTGPLEGREFASMREFAVAAVLEAGYAEADVARLFRFAPWQLRAWIEEARGPRRGPAR